MSNEKTQLREAVKKILAETPRMPVPVSEMTPNEYALFEQLARLCGMMQFIEHSLAAVENEAAAPEPKPEPIPALEDVLTVLRPFAAKAEKWRANHSGLAQHVRVDSHQLQHRYGDFAAAETLYERLVKRETLA